MSFPYHIVSFLSYHTDLNKFGHYSRTNLLKGKSRSECKKHKDRQYLVCVGGMGSILCRKMQYFWKCQSEPHFLMPGQSEVMPGQMLQVRGCPGASWIFSPVCNFSNILS